MKIYKLYCEYDVDQEDVVFSTKAKAYEYALKALEGEFDEEFNWEMIVEEGLVWVEELRIDP